MMTIRTFILKLAILLASTFTPTFAHAIQELHFNAGLHSLNTILILNNNTIVTGAGIGVTVLRPNSNFPEVIANADTSNGNSNITISNLTIDCQN